MVFGTMETMNLAHIAARLEGLEETIIGRLIDRAQWRRNEPAYLPGGSGFTGEPSLSLFEIRLLYQERMDALFGRFEVPEERPFTPGLPPPRRIVKLPPTGLALRNPDLVNLTAQIRERYLALVELICPPGDDLQYGSSVEHDVAAVQAISRRIHYGAMYVAEAKYRERPDQYRELLGRGDTDGLLSLLTRPEVEERIILRVREKVEALQRTVNREVRNLVDPGTIAGFYRDTVIPLTKEGEILYLRHRPEEF